MATGRRTTVDHQLNRPRVSNQPKVLSLSVLVPIFTFDIVARVPITAAETLGEGEFNRFYIRALCVHAINDGIKTLIVYRAKVVANARVESEMKIDTGVDPVRLLGDLRNNPGVDTALGLPAGPNSGLSVRLP
jgi:hypothetical protein